MKNLRPHWSALALTALLLGGCADKSFEPDTEVIESDQTRYLSVALCNPSSFLSRAEDDPAPEEEDPRNNAFTDGATSESDVTQLVFVFYDGSGAPTGRPVNLSGTDVTNNWTTASTNPAITKFWTSVLPVEMTQGQNKPVYVMCFVNPVDQTDLTSMTIQEVEAATRSAIVNNGYFAMSNSVYYGNNAITGQSNVRMMATPIVNDALYDTEDEAKKATANVIDIYVERYAAKIGLSMAPTAIRQYPVSVPNNGEYETIGLTFVPDYWRPNAVDLKTYITKGFSTSVGDSDAALPASFTAMTQAFANTGMPGEGLTGWNDPTNHRSYWACSPSYYANDYPHCSDNITDITSQVDEDGNNLPYPYELKYFTYDEIANGVEGTPVAWSSTDGFNPMISADGKTTTGFFYSRETTAAIEALTADDGTNNKAVPASAVIVGRYKLDGNSDYTTFYLYGKVNGNDVYYTDSNIEQALIANQNVIFTNEEGTKRATSTNYFVVKHPSKAVRDIQNVAGRLVTIQIDETNPPASLYFYDGTKYVPVTKENVVAANRLLWASASTAQKFYNGLAFFSIPIRHLGWGNNVTAPLLSDATSGRASMINWQNLRRGDLGVVRNHVYSIEVTAIEGLGVGLENPDQPIVPPMDPDNYYVAARLNILPWRVVPKATVKL